MLDVQFLGTGTPIGQRGLHQACILLHTDKRNVLVDCGMTALASLGRAAIDPNDIDAVLISHLHGDHYGGLPLLVLDASLRGRTRPLTIAGPAATRARVLQLLETFSWTTSAIDAATFVSLQPGEPANIADCTVTAFDVIHNETTAPTGLRVQVGARTVAYSGDAGWSEALVDIARGADLFICGVWSFDSPQDSFVDLATLIRNRARLECRRLILTHLGPSMLEHLGEVPFEVASDGLRVGIA